MSAAALWSAVKASYDEDGLVTLTNIRDRGATAIDDTAGQDAAAGVLALWPVYAQIEFDAANLTHMEAGKLGVIALLWRRGGTSSAIEQVKWDEVFGDAGVLAKIRRTGPRARIVPRTNSQTANTSESQAATRRQGWSDPAQRPIGSAAQPHRT